MTMFSYNLGLDQNPDPSYLFGSGRIRQVTVIQIRSDPDPQLWIFIIVSERMRERELWISISFSACLRSGLCILAPGCQLVEKGGGGGGPRPNKNCQQSQYTTPNISHLSVHPQALTIVSYTPWLKFKLIRSFFQLIFFKLSVIVIGGQSSLLSFV